MAELAQEKADSNNAVERVAQPDWTASMADASWLKASAPTSQVERTATDATVALPTLHLKDDRLNVYDNYSVNSDVAQTYIKNRPAVVRINTLDPKVDATFSSSAGSGSIIDSTGLIATGYHVVKNAASLRVKTADGKVYEANLVAADSAKDQALIQIKSDNPFATFPAVTLANDSSEAKQHQMMALGFPRREETLHLSNLSFDSRTPLNQLKVNGGLFVGEDPNRELVKAVGPVFKGNSGGPVFDLVTGKQIGIVNMNDATDTYVTPIEDFNNFLRQVQSKYKSPADNASAGRKLFSKSPYSTDSWESKLNK